MLKSCKNQDSTGYLAKIKKLKTLAPCIFVTVHNSEKRQTKKKTYFLKLYSQVKARNFGITLYNLHHTKREIRNKK